jgi:hypothetical protein
MTFPIVPRPLTEEQKSNICGVLSVGCDWHTAANYVGCALADIRRAMQRDAAFAEQVRRADASCELMHMRAVHKAVEDPKNWRTSAWWLERHAPERYGPRGANAVTVRQLKSFIAILADVINGGEQSPIERAEILERLRVFAESVDRLLRNERMQELDALESLGLSQATAPEDADEFTGDAFDPTHEFPL